MILMIRRMSKIEVLKVSGTELGMSRQGLDEEVQSEVRRRSHISILREVRDAHGQ